jgi:methylmalonyl-CoA mutase C-terminal domain/subunit
MAAMNEKQRPIRILLAKPGLDGHDRGAKIVAKTLLEAGMEVIYTGRHQRVAQIVSAALQEDVDVVGLSILSGSHLSYTRRVVEGLREQGMGDKLVVVGGNIPRHDIPALKELGVAEVFPTGTPLEAIVDYIQKAVQR